LVGTAVTDQTQLDAQRVIDAAARKGVYLDVRHYGVPTRTPEESAIAADAELGQIVKSAVFVVPRSEGRLAPIVCLVSGGNQVDPGLLAAVLSESSIRRATLTEIRDLTGFSVADVPPLGYARSVRVVMDQDLGRYQWVWASTGTDGSMFRIAPAVLRMLANAVVAPVSGVSWADTVRQQATRPSLNFEASTAH
jgi:prolyl-tRNA editing enzyme YbaK/EbsC (Cys-tRNA(Pro) deacylase)